MKQPRDPDDVGERRRSYYRPVAIALVAVALTGTGFIIMVIISFAMAMRSFGNK
jgi:hypothetical protein